MKFQRANGFSLVELMVVIGIISLLASLSYPGIEKALDRARSTKCGSNLRQIGIGIMSATQDNDGDYPAMTTDPETGDYIGDSNPQAMLDALKPYGIVGDVLRCPSDALSTNRYREVGTSYECSPIVDDENGSGGTVKFYGRRGIFSMKTSRIRMAYDYESVHGNRKNVLYADGRVNVVYPK